jgi:hypothetical protein
MKFRRKSQIKYEDEVQEMHPEVKESTVLKWRQWIMNCLVFKS